MSLMHLIRNVFALAFVLACTATSATAAEHSSTRPQLLKSLDGQWTMAGDVMGKPVQYDMDAFPTLQGTFTEIHMDDVHVPSGYEARVFIGVDKSGKVIVHWLDSFGAGYSFPNGSGSISGNAIVFTIPYPTGEFRDTLTYQPSRKAWTLVIESKKPDGSWEHFARYRIWRKPAERGRLTRTDA